MPEQDCPRGAQPPLGLQLREPRIRAQGLLGRGVAQDPAFSSNAQSDPSLPTPTCDLLLFILMFTGQYIRLDRNSKAYTMTSPPSPSATSNRIRFPCTFPGMFLAICMYLFMLVFYLDALSCSLLFPFINTGRFPHGFSYSRIVFQSPDPTCSK